MDPIELVPTNLPITISASIDTPSSDEPDDSDTPNCSNNPDVSKNFGDDDNEPSLSSNANVIPDNSVPTNKVPDKSAVQSTPNPSAGNILTHDGTTASKPIPQAGDCDIWWIHRTSLR